MMNVVSAGRLLAQAVGSRSSGCSGQSLYRWHPFCSTEYVRGREAVMPELFGGAFIANRDEGCILRLGEGDEWLVE